MTNNVPDPGRCPLCEQPNQCGVALGAPSCWCFVTRVPEELLAGVPDADGSKRCVCQACVESAALLKRAT